MLRKKQRIQAIKNLREEVKKHGYKITIPEAQAILKEAAKRANKGVQGNKSLAFPVFQVYRFFCGGQGCCDDSKVPALVLPNKAELILPILWGDYMIDGITEVSYRQ